MSRNRLQRGLRATFIGMAVNVLLAAGKFVTGVVGHSNALIADAVESMADVFSSIVVWRGLVVAAAPADEDHPYGHGKAEPIAAAVVAGMLLAAAVGIAIKSLHDLIDAKQAPAAFTLWVLLAVVAAKETLFRFTVREAGSVESSAVRSDAWHHRSDAITSLAAAIGISVALIGGPSYAWADPLAALLAAGIIAWNGARLFIPALSELMDTSPDLALNAKIKDISARVPGVAAVEKCLVRKMGYLYFVDLHVEVDPDMTVQKAHALAHQVKNEIRARIPAVRDVLVHVEPARARDATLPHPEPEERKGI